MVLVLHLGCCAKAKLCPNCIASGSHSHNKPTLVDVVRAQQDRKMRELRPVLERLEQSTSFLLDAPYAPLPKVGDFVGMDARLAELRQLPPLPKQSFIDPLEQLELGRAA